MTRRGLSEDHPLAAKVDQILKAAERAAGLTRQLLAFSRMQVLEARIVDLNALVSNLEAMLARLIGEDIELTTTLAPSLGRVKVDPGQIEQVLMNLVVNARDAMPDGGHLEIETGRAEFDADYVGRHVEARAGPYAMLAVSDSGMGIDTATQAHMFEPFFTTKALGRGTGLGLSTVYGIVKQSGGHIWCYSEVGVGTTFKVYLPLVETDASSARPTPSPVSLAPGRETILLIEDDQSLRELLCETLEGGGYTVLVANGGEEALRMAGEYAGAIQLIVTDVIMPGLTGRQAADTIKQTRSEVQVLFISGYIGDALARHGVLEPQAKLLSKPCTSDALLRKVREVLDGRRHMPKEKPTSSRSAWSCAETRTRRLRCTEASPSPSRIASSRLQCPASPSGSVTVSLLQSSSTSPWESQSTRSEIASVNLKCGPPLRATNSWPSSWKLTVMADPLGPGPASP